VKILAIDIGGKKVKMLASGQTDPRKAPSGRALTPNRLVEVVRELTADWEFEAVSIGYPGLVGDNGPHSDPGNLGPGWVGFNYAAAFDKPVKVVNDATMQALGCYEGGRMLFIGLGTGVGSALIAHRVILPLELGHLSYRAGVKVWEVLGRRGLRQLGRARWRRAVRETVTGLADAFITDYVVIGGGNAKLLRKLPPGARLGNNLTAFRGGFRLWHLEEVPILAGDTAAPPTPPAPADWRLI
jgi:polyphosphate glucokinase